MATTDLRLLRALALFACICICASQEYVGVCDKARNAQLPFCDSSLSFDARTQDLLARLTLNEKIGLLDHTSAGASTNVELDEYNWWNEALHGVAGSPGTQFRPPTEYATVFPQIISFASSFNKQLFFEMGNVTGNEARVFFHSGNSGLTFWSPDINIFRDPRWGRGHETPGEDPHLSGEYAKAFVRGMQGEHEQGFLKTGACCKHFSAHSAEEDRFSFNSIVTAQDMADTYLPAFKTCVEDANVACIMCSYNAINGIPACAHKELLTGTVREKWGLDGYITSDCDAGAWVDIEHHYTNSTSQTCHALLDAGMDLECYYYVRYFEQYLREAVDDGTVPVQMLDTALARLVRVLMRMGYFEKDATRPYKELVPEMVDSQPHQMLALQAARQSIVLLKNAPSARTGRAPLPIDAEALKARHTHARASMAAIGPYITGGDSFLGNYHGRPSFIKEPVDELRKFVPDLEWERGCNVSNFDNPRLQEAEDLARASAQVVLLVGTSPDLENEGRDRANLTFPGLQDELIRRVLAVVQVPVIMFVVSGGAIGLEEWKNDPRVGAIIWAGYLGQSAGEAMADVMFGTYNPSGRLTQTFYSSDFVDQVSKFDMGMRPVNGSPGRTYRFFTGEPVYPFGHGLSYTTFEYSFADLSTSTPQVIPVSTAGQKAEGDCSVEVNVTVRNSGQRAGDHSVLWFIAPPNAGKMGRPIKNLLDFERLNNVQALESRQVQICLNRDDFQLANEQGEFEVVTGEWKLIVGSLERGVLVL